MEGQQVIVIYLGEEIPIPQYYQDGRLLDFPEQTIMATLKATSKASIWSQDSLMFAREGVFAEGFNLFVPGLWEYRNKITGKRLSHRLYYGYFEFDESGLEASDYDGCQEWVIEISGMKTILGISCTKATRQCDGMEQIAYFARSIAIVDGPIFIPEIPGLVLEFNDGKYIYTAQHITANENEIPVPAEVRVIRKEKYSGADSRVVVNKQKMAINSWINLGAKYLIQ